VVAGENELDRELLALGELRNRRLVDGAAREHDRLALQIPEIQDAAAPTNEQLGAGDEHRRRERGHLAALDVVGRRAAFEIDCPPLTRSNRFSGVTGWYLAWMLLPSSPAISSRTISQRSSE
jgi:hypothetical protein